MTFVSGYTEEASVRCGVLYRGVVLLPRPFTPDVSLREIVEITDGRGSFANA